ncbi:hypothetical protein M758_9G001100 [Ceratodon purpureus]|nr:hypothetical protein M758_9G001100 [Ceratodon purpureus]
MVICILHLWALLQSLHLVLACLLGGNLALSLTSSLPKYFCASYFLRKSVFALREARWADLEPFFLYCLCL